MDRVLRLTRALVQLSVIAVVACTHAEESHTEPPPPSRGGTGVACKNYYAECSPSVGPACCAGLECHDFVQSEGNHVCCVPLGQPCRDKDALSCCSWFCNASGICALGPKDSICSQNDQCKSGSCANAATDGKCT